LAPASHFLILSSIECRNIEELNLLYLRPAFLPYYPATLSASGGLAGWNLIGWKGVEGRDISLGRLKNLIGWMDRRVYFGWIGRKYVEKSLKYRRPLRIYPNLNLNNLRTTYYI